LITQTASASTSSAQTQNGYAAGTLASFSVLANGTVQGTFSNGQTRAIGQVAVASFSNPEGLQLLGNNQYQVTASSGQAVVGTAGTGGRGTIIGSSVEQSNVDVATQLSDLIVAQRSYEANAKAITTLDQIEQDTISMKSA
jgi:flagellar hook protein FlgE